MTDADDRVSGGELTCSRRPSSTWSAASSTTRTTSRSTWSNNRRGQRLEVRVHPDDLGRVIGRNGRTAKALRQVVNGVGGKGVRVDVDRRRPPLSAERDP